MAPLFALLSIVPALISFFSTGDFPQMIIKPPRPLVNFVFRYRFLLMAASFALYLVALLYYSAAPTSSLVMVLAAFLDLFLLGGAFFVVPLIMFPVQTRHPKWVDADKAGLMADDEIVGVEINGDARAYPVKWITRPHIVQDQIGGEPVAMTYCGLSHLGQAFRAEINGQPLDPQVVVQIENNLVFYDTTSQRLFQQIDTALDGQKPLTEIATRLMPWSAWHSLYPQTKVFYNPIAGPLDKAIRTLVATLVTRQLDPSNPAPVFPTLAHVDSRLNPKSRVLGVGHNGAHKAYSLDYLRTEPVINDTLGGLPLVILYDAKRDVADVFERTLNGRPLNLKPVSNAPEFVVQDVDTGTQWNIQGEEITNGKAGGRLAAYPHASRILWMIWYNYFPDTQLAC